MAAFGKLILQSRNCGIEDLAVTVDDGFGLTAVIGAKQVGGRIVRRANLEHD